MSYIEINAQDHQKFYNGELMIQSPKNSLLVFDKTCNIIRSICQITGNVTTWDGSLETWLISFEEKDEEDENIPATSKENLN
jgi:hypothetical protein